MFSVVCNRTSSTAVMYPCHSARRNAGEQTLAMRLAAEQCMVERRPLYRGYLDMGTFFMSVANDVAWAVERRAGVAPAAIQVIQALREGVASMGVPGLSGRYETAYGLTRRVRIGKGLGQGDLSSPVRSKLVLAVMQQAVSRLVRGFKFAGVRERVPIFLYADDGCYLTDDLASLQLAFDTAWVVTKLMGLKFMVKGKAKSAWSGVYWSGAEEKDVEGYELKLPCGMVVPQLQGKEFYKYLGTELPTGWAEGKNQETARAKVRTQCRRLLWMIGSVPVLTDEQMGKAMSLAVAGTIGFYGRATAVTWGDCKAIEEARAEVLRAKGRAPGSP